MSDPVSLVVDGAIGRVVLDRPEVSNALDDVTIVRGLAVLAEAAGDPAIRVVILEGRGKHFCAGADLTWMKRSVHHGSVENTREALELAGLFRAIHRFPKPVIAKVQGAAIGGGAGLAAASDIAVAGESASFGFSEVRLGLIPAVISPYVVMRMGPVAAKRMFLTGQRVDGREAFRLGLVDRVVPAEALDAAVLEIAGELVKGGPGAQARIKDLVRMVAGQRPEEVEDATARAIASVRTTTEAQEGMTAFLEKRPPAWDRKPGGA